MVGEVITGFRSTIGIDGVEVKIIPDWDTLIVEANESNWLEDNDAAAAGEADDVKAIDVEDDDGNDVVTVEVKASNWFVEKLKSTVEDVDAKGMEVIGVVSKGAAKMVLHASVVDGIFISIG